MTSKPQSASKAGRNSTPVQVHNYKTSQANWTKECYSVNRIGRLNKPFAACINPVPRKPKEKVVFQPMDVEPETSPKKPQAKVYQKPELDDRIKHGTIFDPEYVPTVKVFQDLKGLSKKAKEAMKAK